MKAGGKLERHKLQSWLHIRMTWGTFKTPELKLPSEFLGIGTRHQYFIRLFKLFQCAAKVGKLYVRGKPVQVDNKTNKKTIKYISVPSYPPLHQVRIRNGLRTHVLQ